MYTLLQTQANILPFVLELNSGIALEGICFITAVGFFGLDEVRHTIIFLCFANSEPGVDYLAP